MMHRPSCAAVALVLVTALTGCGVSGGGDVKAGFPTPTPKLLRVPLTPMLAGFKLELSVPPRWGVGRLSSNGQLSLVRELRACYLSISITGAAVRQLGPGAINGLYPSPVDGYSWKRTQSGSTVIELLAQYSTSGRPPSRSTLGTAFVRIAAGKYLLVDIGAGIWPLLHHTCSVAAFKPLIPQLQANVAHVFGGVRLRRAPARAAGRGARATVTGAQTAVSEQ